VADLGTSFAHFSCRGFSSGTKTHQRHQRLHPKNAVRLGREAYCAANISAHLAIWPSVDSVASADLFQGCQTDAEAFRYLLLGEPEILTEFFNRHTSWTSHDDAALSISARQSTSLYVGAGSEACQSARVLARGLRRDYVREVGMRSSRVLVGSLPVQRRSRRCRGCEVLWQGLVRPSSGPLCERFRSEDVCPLNNYGSRESRDFVIRARGNSGVGDTWNQYLLYDLSLHIAAVPCNSRRFVSASDLGCMPSLYP
jgi:hypothetical protein